MKRQIDEPSVNPHIHHRLRLKERFLRDGAQKLDDRTLLELLLCYAVPRADTVPIASALLERFGSLYAICSAPMSEIMQTAGVKEHTAILIKILPEFSRRISDRPENGALSFFDESVAVSFLKNFFAGLKEERVLLLCLDPKGGLIQSKELHRGSVNSAAFSVRLVTETAINNESGKLILAHNHPSGSAIPSDEDIYTTQRLAAALLINDIELCEHYIVAGERCTPIMKNMPNRYSTVRC